jgi:DHA2 family multidrug resistance protein
VLTIWGNSQQEAHGELASRLQPDETLRTLAGAGMNSDQATRVIANLVDREAMTMAVDHVFLITAAIFFLCAAVIWFAPKPKGYGPPVMPH